MTYAHETLDYKRGYAAALLHGEKMGWEPAQPESRSFWNGFGQAMRDLHWDDPINDSGLDS